MQRHCLHYSLFGHQHSFQDMYYDGTHSSPSSRSSSSSPPSSSELLQAFSSIPSSYPVSKVRTDDLSGANRLVGYIIFNFYRWLAFYFYFYFYFSSFLQINRDDNIMQAWRLALLFYFIRGVVWCGIFASYLLPGWIALVTLGLR